MCGKKDSDRGRMHPLFCHTHWVDCPHFVFVHLFHTGGGERGGVGSAVWDGVYSAELGHDDLR